MNASVMTPKSPGNSLDLSGYEWMIRPCEMYQDEYKDCTSLKSRFHQYFIYGESSDCTQWKRDMDNCERWIANKNVKSRDELIKSEKIRQAKRLSGHVLNDVWEDREKPPSDWNKPLPDWMQKEHEATYLGIKANELKNNVQKSPHEDRSLCVIS
ncbi:UNVERIFIED_CONTAM: hypothetical protein B566_EDAN018673 [Ephemera danica]|nr:hypothetical protein B566_EDAN018673 [Ephemera danica]